MAFNLFPSSPRRGGSGFQISGARRPGKGRQPLRFGGTANIRTPDNPFGMNAKMQRKLNTMLVLLALFILFIVGDLGGKFLTTRNNMVTPDDPKWGKLDRQGEAEKSSSGVNLVLDDPELHGADPDLQVPVANTQDAGSGGLEPDPATGTDGSTGNGANSAGTPPTNETGSSTGSTGQPLPIPSGNLDPATRERYEQQYREEQRQRIEAVEKQMQKPRPREISAAILDPVGVTGSDIRRNDYGELHRELLRIVHDVPAEKLREVAYSLDEISPSWYTLREGDSEIKAYIGRAFTVEATLFALQPVDPVVFNLEDVEIVDGKPLEKVWRGVLAFGYDIYVKDSENQLNTQREYAVVQFSTVGELPEGITPERVADPAQKPVRLRVTGLFFHLRAVPVGGDAIRIHPHLVLGPLEVIEPLPANLDMELLRTVRDETDEDRRDVPLAAQQNMLYVLRHLENPAAFDQSFDRSITYGDLFHQPQAYRAKPTVVKFEGQIGQVGTEENPVVEYGDAAAPFYPNPYGVRHQYFGTITVLDEHARQQVLAFDAVNIELWDEKAGQHYNYAEALKNGGKTPSGETVPSSPFKRGAEVEIIGYPLWKWRYKGKDNEYHEVPRLIVRVVRQLPTRTSEASSAVWILGAAFVVILFIVFFLFRREQGEADNFRKEFIKKHVGKLHPQGKIAGHTPAVEKPAETAAPASDAPASTEPQSTAELPAKPADAPMSDSTETDAPAAPATSTADASGESAAEAKPETPADTAAESEGEKKPE